ncbi:HEXXH motif-containing putative peptide modification protein [Streptomyces sp. NPDC000070]|uniref:aKG-HExxH-type peptide beta-hydroxylase n=1 Tax=Streptomyces sp. NPDC000070 TaxID=3154240 RepID=UPI0033292B2F
MFAAVLHLFDLFEPGGEERYYAPWRPDPRLLIGLFHGAYAHLGVAEFWNRHRAVEQDPEELARAHAQFVRRRTGAREATEVLLSSGRLTALGQHFAETMLRTLETLGKHSPGETSALGVSRRVDAARDPRLPLTECMVPVTHTNDVGLFSESTAEAGPLVHDEC